MTGSRATFIGGMNAPGPSNTGRGNATIPLAILEITDAALRLRARGLGSLVVPEFVAELADLKAAFRLRGRFFSSGVGIWRSDGVVAYFWTWTKHDEVLTELAVREVPILPGRHRSWGLMPGNRPPRVD